MKPEAQGPLHRVFFDSNLGDDVGGYPLLFDQSKRDLVAIGDELREGLRVIIYMPDELEVEAILRRGNICEQECWVGVPIGEWKLLDAPSATSSR